MWTELWGALRAAGLRDECVGDTCGRRVGGQFPVILREFRENHGEPQQTKLL